MAVYSYSRINCFFTCPRKYRFQYIDRPKIEKKTGVEAFMGSMVHKALEQCYHLVKADKPPSWEELESIYTKIWAENLPDNLHIVREEMTAEDYFAIGRKALRWYHETYYPFDSDITLGLERRVDIELDVDGKYRMQGFIDRLAQDKDGRLVIQDYKTGGKLPTQKEVDEDGQLALYQLAVDEMWPNNSGIILRRYYLQHHMPLESRRSDEQLQELRGRYIRNIQHIEKETRLGNFPAIEGPLCKWCEYNEICPAKGGSGVVNDGQAELPLVTGEPLQELVDEFIALNEQKREITRRLDEIKQQLVMAAEHENTKRIDGKTAGSVTVSTKTIEKLPTKSSNPEVYELIDKIVREEGLFDTYGSLDIRSLQKAFDAMELPEQVQDTLSQWAEQQSSSRVNISTKKKGA